MGTIINRKEFYFMYYGLNENMILSKKEGYWNFSKFIREIEGFNSLKHYDKWLSEMSEEDRNTTRWYYTEKYTYILRLLGERKMALC